MQTIDFDVVSQSFVRLDHHSAVCEEPVTQRIPLMVWRVASQTSVEAVVVPPGTIATCGTVFMTIIVVLVVRREFHSVVQPDGATSVILERPSELRPITQSSHHLHRRRNRHH